MIYKYDTISVSIFEIVFECLCEFLNEINKLRFEKYNIQTILTRDVVFFFAENLSKTVFVLL